MDQKGIAMTAKVLILAAKANMIRQFNQRNINLLQDLGYEVHVATNFIEFGTMSSEENDSLKEWLVNNDVQMHQISFDRGFGTIKSNVSSIIELFRLIKFYKFDFLHVHSPLASVLTRIVAAVENIPVLYTAHGFQFYKGSSILNWMFVYPIEFLLAFVTQGVITINLEDSTHARYMPYKTRYYIPGNGVDVSKRLHVESNEKLKKRQKIRKSLGIGMDEIVILTVGALTNRKNQKSYLRVIKKFKNEGIKVKYLIVGVGELEQEYRSYISQQGMNDTVKLLGYRTDVSDLNYAADIFLFASRREGFGIAGLDAVVDGLYIVGSTYGGMKDYIDSASVGVLVNPDNETEIYEELKKL